MARTTYDITYSVAGDVVRRPRHGVPTPVAGLVLVELPDVNGATVWSLTHQRSGLGLLHLAHPELAPVALQALLERDPVGTDWTLPGAAIRRLHAADRGWLDRVADDLEGATRPEQNLTPAQLAPHLHR